MINDVVDSLVTEQPQLRIGNDTYRHLIVDHAISDEPALHLDDYSEYSTIGEVSDAPILQQRSRLRAFADDWVVLTRPIENGFSEYCEHRLGLGRVNWLYPAVKPGYEAYLALECWRDRDARHDLMKAIRQQGLRYIHPHISTLHAWELASQLRHATRKPLSVIGPPPVIARWANNKIEFTRAAARLLGQEFVPRTESAYNFATLSQKAQALAETNERLGIKFPFGMGGHGIFLVDSKKIRGLSLAQTRDHLKKLLSGSQWPKCGQVLIDVWESNVITSPSVQTWIPPFGFGDPLIEGIFEQAVVGDRKEFVGSCYVGGLLPSIEQQIVDGGYMLAKLFQQLGYVGRCSFDLILVGQNLENCRVEFVESNARWGGTSIPMTLMNRLGMNPPENEYCVRMINLPGLERIEFSQLLQELKPDLFDAKTREGRLVLFNPGRLESDSAIEAIAIGKTASQASQYLSEDLPQQISQLVARQSLEKPDQQISK
jgi:hypothetical protein